MTQPTAHDTQDTRPRVMAIFAHPDDAEFICSGTIARFVRSGYRAQYVLATSGDKGSDDRNARPDRPRPPAHLPAGAALRRHRRHLG